MPAETSPSSAALSESQRQLLQQRLRRAIGSQDKAIGRRPDGVNPPVSSSQERMWFVEQLSPGTAAYVVAAGRRLQGALDLKALDGALAELEARHEALRMTFPATADGSPEVVIRDVTASAGTALQTVDISDFDADPAVRGQRASALAGEAVAVPFDLAAGPLFRVLLIRIAPEDHALVLMMHHIISDGWSVEILMRDLFATYARLRDGATDARTAANPESAVQFGDYAMWERDRRSGADVQRHLAYWVGHLADVPPLEPGIGRPRPAEQAYEGALHEFALNAELSEAVTALGRRCNATVYMTLMAAFQAVLSRHSAQYDFAVGSPVAGRSHRELEGVVGPFVNMLAIRAHLNGDPSFQEIVTRTRDTALEALSRQEVPFDLIVNELKIERDPSRSPLFQVTFAMNDLSVAAGTGTISDASAVEAQTGLVVREFATGPAVSQFDLALYATSGPGGLSFAFTYRTDLFDAADIEGLARRMELLLRAATADPALRLSALPILTEAEREQVVDGWALGTAPARAAGADRIPSPRSASDSSSGHATLVAAVEAQADLTPGAAAVTHEGQSLTHGDLDVRANRLARRLLDLGAGPGKPVAICLPQSLDLAVAIVAVLKSGSPYLPIDPHQPPERVAYILGDARAVALITDAAMPAALETASGAGPGWAGACLDLAAGQDRIEAEDATRLALQAGPGDPAYVIYTSGTTGRPKGVVVQHHAIVRYLHDIRQVLEIEPDSGYALLQSLSFDFSLLMFYLPLIAGGCLHLLPQKIAGDELAAAIERLGVDYLKMTPSHLAALGTDLAPERLLPRRALVLAGEALPAEWVVQFAASGRCAVVNSYGPTEAVVAVTTHRIDPSAGARTAAVPIGRPMEGVRTMVLDDYLNPLPPGVAGELYVGGTRLAHGYLNKPGLTAERFIADPFGAPGGRLYRTGDRARWLADGTLEFLGRTDHQVKIRGYRVELGEVEAALGELPGVMGSLAELRGPAGREQLIGYLDLGPGNTPELDAGQLRAALAARLPEYMMPARFVQLHGFPRQAHGKVDRKALPEPEGTGAAASVAGFIAPRDETERTIAEIWKQLLELDEVGVRDNFFDLGGHSLMATRAVARLRRAFDGTAVTVTVMDMFKYPTVAQLAALITGQQDTSGEPQLIYEMTAPIPDAERKVTFVCAPYGGAHASVFQQLAAQMPTGCALYAVESPGRGLAPGAEPQPVEQVAEAVADEILRFVSGPLVIYGHCGPGGALAVALAQRLEAVGRDLDALYLGGIFPFARPSGLFGRLSRLVEMDALRADRNHANWLRGMGSELTDLDEEQAGAMIRVMRQDGRLAEEYLTGVVGGAARRLRVPVISVVGTRDPATRFFAERYTEWGFLSGTLGLVVLAEAGHFFVRYRAAELAAILTGAYGAILEGRAGELSREAMGDQATWWLHEVTRVPDAGQDAPSAADTAAPADTVSAPVGRMRGPNRFRDLPAAAAGTGNDPVPSLGRFAIISSGQLVSLVGSTLTEFALPLWVYLQTGSLARFGLLAVLGLVPGILSGPLAGALVDRYDRRRVMMLGDLVSGAIQAVLFVLAVTGTLRLWHLYILISVLSVAVSFQRTAYFSAIPQVVPKRYLGHANGMVQTGFGVAQFIAPLLGVGLLASIGLRGILGFDVASYAVAIGAVLVVRFPARMADQRSESVLKEITQGVTFTLGQPNFRAAILFFAALNLFLAPLFVLISPLVLSFAHLGAVAAAAFAGGLGGVVAGLVMSAWGGPQRQRMRAIQVTALMLAAFAALTGLRPDLPLVVAGAFGMAFSIGTANGIIMTILQTKVPQRLQGRMFALNTTIASATAPIGFGVLAPYGTELMNWLVSSHGVFGTVAHDVLGDGPGRGIGLMYFACAGALALLALGSGLIPRIARFDAEVPDAQADDLIGLEEARHRTRLTWPPDSTPEDRDLMLTS